MNAVKLNKLFLFICTLFLLTRLGHAQGNAQCGNATPFCTGVPVSYPASTNAGSAPSGPSYGCLGSEPNPAFFFLQMSTSGPVVISMGANNDIDFICWGPYPSLAGVCSNLTAGFIQSCSYSPSNTETCTISSAVAGQFYVLLITNFSNQNQQINFTQTNNSSPGAGTTNCGIICGINMSNNGPVCAGQSVTLTATTNTSISSYTLMSSSGVVATSSLASVSNTLSFVVPSVTASTTYSFMASNSSSTCQTTSYVQVIDYPSYTITPAHPTICQGGNTTVSVTLSPTLTASNFSFNWSSFPPPGTFQSGGPGAGIVSPGNQQTNLLPSLLPVTTTVATIIYSVVVTPTILSCPVVHTVALTINNPLTPTLSVPATICSTVAPVQFTANPIGGIWGGNTGITNTGLFTPASSPAGNNVVGYTVSVGSCSVHASATVGVALYNSPQLTSSVSILCEQDPQVDLMSIVQNTIGSWVSVLPYLQNNKFNPTGLATGTYALTYTTPSSPTISPNLSGVCPGSTVFVVGVYKPVVPSISSIPAFCNNATTIQLVATPTVGGQWVGTGVSALTGVLTPSVYSTGGIYFVTYSSGQGTCVASTQTSFTVSEFHTAALSGTLNQLCANSNPVNLQTIVVDTHGTWTGINTTGNLFSPAAPQLQTGVYTLTYTNPNYPFSSLVQCVDVQTLAVSVYNPPSAIITQVGPYCNTHAPVQLTVTPNTGYWVSTSYLTSGGLFTPSMSPVGSSQVQYIIGTSTCNTHQAASISIEAFVPATITGSIADQCTTNPPLNLQPFTLNSQGSWSGPGILGSSFNPSVALGVVTLTYGTASSPSGLCPDQATVSVHVYSLATPFIPKLGPFCNSFQPVKLAANPVGGVYGGINTNAVDPQGLFNPATSVIGDNLINYSITSGPCVAFVQTTITIEKFISADFTGPEGPFCKNDPRLVRNLNEIALNPGGEWEGPGVTANGLFTFANANIGSNNIIKYRTHSLTDQLCPDTSFLRIRVYDVPAITAKAAQTQSCAPVEVRFSSPSINFGDGQWDFGDGSEPQMSLSATHVYNTPGTYTVVFTYSAQAASDLECVAQAIANPVKVFEMPAPDFRYNPDEIIISSPVATLTNLSPELSHNRYSWSITGNGLNQTSYEVDPAITFPLAGDYLVTLTATNLSGCKNQVSKTVTVKATFNMYIPNSFTPNDDGLNDNFNPVFSEYGVDDGTYLFQIFDRWGNMLFQTKEMNQGWDGKKGGKLLKQDVYVYKLKYKDLEGNVYNKTGFVTLLQ